MAVPRVVRRPPAVRRQGGLPAYRWAEQPSDLGDLRGLVERCPSFGDLAGGHEGSFGLLLVREHTSIAMHAISPAELRGRAYDGGRKRGAVRYFIGGTAHAMSPPTIGPDTRGGMSASRLRSSPQL